MRLCILTTASLGVMPLILNMAALKMSEQMKEAWKEKIKLNVTYMVEELVHKDSTQAQTEVIIPWQDDTTNEITNDNDQVNEERVELIQTEVMIHEEHDTTNEYQMTIIVSLEGFSKYFEREKNRNY